MKMATYVEISILDFWELEPYEIEIAYKSYVDRITDEYEAQRQLLTMQAYEISRWVWQKKVDIDKILGIKEEKKTMSDDAMYNFVKILTEQLDGEVVYKNK